MGFGGDEDFGGLIAGIRGPGLRTSERKDFFPLWKGRYDLEWFW